MKKRKDKIRKCYPHEAGYQMFNAAKLIPDIKKFLVQEVHVLGLIFLKNNKEYKHLIEIGCGYGRYLEWAFHRCIHYDGLDFVSWMTTIGKYRCRKLFKQNKRCACHIHNSTIENLPVVIRKKKFGLQKGHRLVFFPFNCFGNIRNLKKIMQVLKLLKADVFISTYRSDSIASEIRGRYYRQCGYAGVICKRTNKGHIVKSQKELYSYAYNQQYLEMLCKEANLRLAKIFQLSNIGVGYLFKHI